MQAAAKLGQHSVGVGLRGPHYADLLNNLPDIHFLEIHGENYFQSGGKSRHFLQQLSEQYAISIHGVALSLASADPINYQHLAKIKSLVDEYQPIFVSEHLCWSSINEQYFHDLLPLPYTEESLQIVCDKIKQTQDFLGRQILIENITSYLQYQHSIMSEPAFINECVERTGCGILLDISNLYINCHNHGWDAVSYLNELPCHAIQECHLGGYVENQITSSQTMIIDSHNTEITAPVWQLYNKIMQEIGARPTLIEWDKDIPRLAVLIEQSQIAKHIMTGIPHAEIA